MKKIMMLVLACAVVVLAGCHSTPPTPEKMESVSKTIGYASGMVANLSKIDSTNKVVVIDIVKKVSTVIPKTNETFAATWTPIAEEHTSELVKKGKINDIQKKLILDGFSIAVSGIDYIFDVKYPEAKNYENLISAAVHGFTDGFLAVFTVDENKKSAFEYDKDAYDFLIKKK